MHLFNNYNSSFYTKKSFKNKLLCSCIPFCSFHNFLSKKRDINSNKKKIKTICVSSFVKGKNHKTDICCEIGQLLSDKGLDVCFIKKKTIKIKDSEIIIPKNHSNLFEYKDIGYDAKILSQIADTFLVEECNNIKYQNKQYDYIIIDDWFCDKKLNYNINIVVFDEKFFIGNGYKYPAGPLKNNLKKLKKADFVIIVNNTLDNDINKKMRNVEILTNYISIEKILYANVRIKNDFTNSIKNGDKYLVFSSKNDEYFEKLIKQTCIHIIDFIKLPSTINKYDEYKTNEIMKEILNRTNNISVNRIITNKKDYVKISQSLIKKVKIECLETYYDIEKVDLILFFNKLKSLIVCIIFTLF